MNTAPITPENLTSPIGLIAGNGRFPIEFAENARARGLSVVVAAIHGEADPKLVDLAERCTWFRVGQLGKMIKALKRSGVKQAAFAGGVTRVNFVDGIRVDWVGLKMLSRMRSFNDDAMLRNIIGIVEEAGITVIAASILLEESVPHPGRLTRRGLSEAEIADAKLGWEAARAIGALDIGQSVVVRNKTVIAVEAVEGTDATVARAGKVRGSGGVLVKLSKPFQDLRVDLPAVGVRTIELMIENNLSALIVEAGKSIMLDPQAVLQRADAAGIAIFAGEAIDDLERVTT